MITLLVSARDLDGQPALRDTWGTPFDSRGAMIRSDPFPYTPCGKAL